ncbi:MAG: phosphatase PAP2 family protein [Chloroflexota bacterium]
MEPVLDPPAQPDPLVRRVRRSLDRRWIGAIVIVVALYAISVLTPNGQLVSDLVLTGRPMEDPDRIAAAKDVLGSVSIASLLVAGLVIAGIALARRRPWMAVGVLVAIAGANVSTQVLKRMILPRPALSIDLGVGVHNSFPSGHVTVAAVLGIALLVVVAPRWRPVVAVAAGVFLLLIGTSTLVAGWHRAEDIMGGGAVALAWVAGVSAVVVRRRGAVPVAAGHARTHQAGGRLLLGLGLVLLILGGATWVAAFDDPSTAIDILDDGTFSSARLFAGAFTVAIATALLTVATLWRAIRSADLETPRA